jgi:hypothetical protein
MGMGPQPITLRSRHSQRHESGNLQTQDRD